MVLVLKVEVEKLDGQGEQIPAAAQLETAGELRGPSQNLRFTLNQCRCVVMRQKLPVFAFTFPDLSSRTLGLGLGLGLG